MASNTVQSTGNVTITFVHPLLLDGLAITLANTVKLNETYLTSTQQIPNSKVIALLGGAATVTNSQKIGDLTFNVVRGTGNVADGDLVAICQNLQSLADSVGGLIRFSIPVNGGTESITFTQVTLESFPPLILAGNDLPSYACKFNYQGFA